MLSTTGPRLLAPRWHTALLIGILLGPPLLSVWVPAAVPSSGGIGRQYLTLIGAELVLFLLVWLGGLRPAGTPLRAVLGPGPGLKDLLPGGLAAVLLVSLSHLVPLPTPSCLLPETVADRISWCAVALTAAFSEELLYRGYLQQQLSILTTQPALGLLTQALLFGVAHGDRGVRAAVLIAVYGLVLGLLARRCHRLWPGVLCHATIDLMAGLASH